MEFMKTTNAIEFLNAESGMTTTAYTHTVSLPTTSYVTQLTMMFLAQDQTTVTFMTIGPATTNTTNLTTGTGFRQHLRNMPLIGGQAIDMTHNVMLIPFMIGFSISKNSPTGTLELANYF